MRHFVGYRLGNVIRLIIAVFVSVGLPCFLARGDNTFIWQGGDGAFSDSMHWKDQDGMNGVPGGSDLAGFVGSATVSGGGSVKIVDVEGSFTFTGHISASGSPTSAGFFVGAVGATAVANFGAGSQLSSAAPWAIGDGFGSGTVNLSGGATATAFDLGNPAFAAINLGFSGGGGTINISGSGTVLDSNGELNVGNVGIGTLMISSGGLLKTRSNDPADAGAQIGAAQFSSGNTATVTGMGSQWQNTGQLNVGASGRGILAVSSGGSITTGAGTAINPGLMVGFFESGVGIVNVDGMNSNITSNDQTVVGGSGFGTINITGGGTITSNGGMATGAILGNNQKGDGTVNVSGSGSKWTISSGLIVGNAGTGELNISGQGTVKLSGSPNYLVIGATKTGFGAVNLSGDGSMLDTGAAPITVGDAGNGLLSLSDTAKMSITGDVTVAAQITSGTVDAPSELDINDTGTQLITTQGVHVGVNGFGTANVKTGGFLQSASGIAGEMANGNGSIDITGDTSQWKITGNLTIGGGGTGSVTVEQGGQLTVMGADVILGRDKNSIGVLTLRNLSTQFTFAGNPVIGSLGSGTLNVELGFQLDQGTKTLTLGGLQGSTGTLNVRDDNTIAVFNNATIGDAGIGNVVVESKGLLHNAGDVTLGNQAGGVGGAIIKDDGSKWQIDGNLVIGQSGDSNNNGIGTVFVSDNTTLAVGNDKEIVLGQESGSVGTLIVEGANAHVTGPALEIGRHGIGTLQLQNRAAFTVGATVLGSQTDGAGRITVLGVGPLGGQQTTLTVNGTLVVGGASAGVDGGLFNASSKGGELGIVNGGQVIVSSGDLVVARDANSTGLVNLSEAGSLLQISAGAGGVTIGQGGTGAFNISNGAQFSTTFVSVGEMASSGTTIVPSRIVVTGTGMSGSPNTSFTASSTMVIGDAGKAEFDASNGAQITSQAEVTLGSQTGSNGIVTLTDKGTVWNFAGSALTIGKDGHGEVDVMGGAMAQGGGLITLGSGSGSGLLKVSGAGSMFVTQALLLGSPTSNPGAGGDGGLIVDNGASVGTKVLNIGGQSGTGHVALDGSQAPANLLVTDTLIVGRATPNMAALSITGGGVLTYSGNNVMRFATPSTTDQPGIIVSGTGSQLMATNANLDISSGIGGPGVSVLVNDGGLISTTSVFVESNSGHSTVTVGGTGAGSTLMATGGVTVNGTLDVAAGGNVKSNGLFLEDGSIAVHQQSASIVDSGGAAGINVFRGTVDVSSGGNISTSGRFTVGSSGTATITVANTNSQLSAATMEIGNSSGTTSLTASDSGHVAVQNSLVVGNNGTISASGGSFDIGATSGQALAGNITVGFGGSLKNSGNVFASAINLGLGGVVGGSGNYHGALINGGTVKPGDPQTMTITGDYTQLDGGLLQIAIAGNTLPEFDHLNVTGHITLDSGAKLELDFINRFAPKMGNTFDFLHADNSVTGGFDNVTITGLESGFQYSLTPDGAGNLALIALNDGVAVPEPNVISFLLFSAFGAMAFRARRR